MACRIRLVGSVVVLLAVSIAAAGPQHWGSGYPYLITLEQTAKGRRLVAYEPPLRAKSATWIRRWIDARPAYDKAAGPIAVGDFWPGKVGKEYVALLVGNCVQIVEAPEMFGTMPWSWLGKASVAPGIKQLAAGNVCGGKSDQLVALTQTELRVYELGDSPQKPTLALRLRLPLPTGMKVNRMACGDFWGDKREEIAFIGSNDETRFVRIDGTKLVEVCRARGHLPMGACIAADFVKDGFRDLTVLQDDGELELYAAPLRPGTKKDEGPNYTGKGLSGQWLPGAAGSRLVRTMSGRLEEPASLLGAAAGRVFGYVNEETTSAVRKRNGIDSRPDAEIAFVSRFPIHNLSAGAPHFGWPLKGETYGYDIAIKNNGSDPIPAGAKLSVWFGSKHRNADVLSSPPDRVFALNGPIPPFDHLHPRYIKIRVEGKWPYRLIPCSPKATWKKINLYEVGERWLVCKLECQGDRTLRNNRYEAAIHSHTFHPIFREGNLADRKPTVAGDPCSFEYLHRKLADAVTCVWERSATADNEDVLQRAYFDGYEFGYPSEVKPEKAMLAAWKKIQDKWEGWRELDIWTGENQGWEKYDWQYSPELHETGHLFHPLGDLYGNYVSPVWLRAIRMADGSPVQMETNLWGPDLYGDGHALIGPNACELMKRYIVGARGAGIDSWWTVAPKQIKVKIVDRSGKPVPDADVTFWSDSKQGPIGSGKTDAQGCWDISPLFGPQTEPDRLGIRHFSADKCDNLVNFNAFVFTVKIGEYVDEAICDTADVNSHSRLTMLYHAMRDPESWTWTFKTNYAPKAAAPDFRLVGAVQGTVVSMGIEGPRAKYALYRRWEPAYIRTRIGEFQAGDGMPPIVQDMAEPDSHAKGRFRAIYEVTRLTPEGESLPRRISVCGLKNACGVTAINGGRLVVATNAGIANPFAVLYDGTTPAEELFYHYRFGHTAYKVVQSVLKPERYYVTLASSDVNPGDYRFDVAEFNPERGGYDVRNGLGGFDCVGFSGVQPQTIELKHAELAAALNPGDAILVGEEKLVRIISVKGTTVVTDGPVFSEGATGLRFEALRLAGVPGSREGFRELKDARSLACFVLGGKEYVVIADTGNRRVVVWDDKTSFMCSFIEKGFTPSSVVADPRQSGSFWVLGHTDAGADVRKMAFDGKSIQALSVLPVVAGAVSAAVAADPDSNDLFMAVTDPGGKRVVEYRIIQKPNEGRLAQMAVYDRAIGVYSGGAQLTNPVDLAYTTVGGKVQLLAIDGGDRLLRLR